MAEEQKTDQNETESTETATIGCGFFNFLKKKKENGDHAPKEEVQRSRGHTSSSSSDEEGANVEKIKKNGLKDKIKEKISGKKERENTKGAEKTNGIANGGAEAGHSEERGFIDKIKNKFSGQHKKAEDRGTCTGHCDVDEDNENKGVFDKVKGKLPVGHNIDEENRKEN